MKIIIGNFRMADYTGSELFTRDLALGLVAKGHSVIVFSSVWGNDLKHELKNRAVRCVDNLSNLAEKPDVIIGNTHLETIACLAYFPGIPAIFICHNSLAFESVPPAFSRIHYQVAVDLNCAEFLTFEHNIRKEDISIIQNGIDLQRFLPRKPLPACPQTALVFGNYSTDKQEMQIIRAVCASMNIALDIVGMGMGNPTTHPEHLLPKYDLVFAKARCAMEAMAVGCAVILLNEGFGMNDMVTMENVKEWHQWNFGRKLLHVPINAENIYKAIKKYSAQDAALVSQYIRLHVDLNKMVDSLEQLAKSTLLQTNYKTADFLENENKEFVFYFYEINRKKMLEAYLLQKAAATLVPIAKENIQPLPKKTWLIVIFLKNIRNFFRKLK